MTDVKILDGNTFVVSDSAGDIEASATDPTGLFSFDTRFLSRWVLTVNGERLTALSTDDLQYFETRFFLIPGGAAVYQNSKQSVIRTRAVADGFHEQITVLNHDEKPFDLTLRLEVGSDFADLFEVKDALQKKGKYGSKVERGRLVLGYGRKTYGKATTISARRRREVRPQRTDLPRPDPAAGRVVHGGGGDGLAARRPRRRAKAREAGPRAPGSTAGSATRRVSNATGRRSRTPTCAASSTSPRSASRR